MSDRRAGRMLWIFAATAALAVLALCVGRYPSPGFTPVWEWLKDPLFRPILLEMRLPRIALALLAGGVLAGAGFVLQMVFANPLVEPGFLGVTQGAATGAAATIVWFGYTAAGVQSAAAAGALAGLAASWWLARRFRFGGWTLRLVLAGLAVSALLGAALSFIKLVAEPTRDLQDITFWMMGGLWRANWGNVGSVAPAALVSLVVMWAMRWRLNLLSLADRTAHSVGLRPDFERGVLVVAAAVGTAAVVSASGPIGWVGLLVPHAARRVFGADSRWALPGAVLLGAALLLACDTVARTAMATEIPVGLLTSVLGAGGFCHLLARRARGRVE